MFLKRSAPGTTGAVSAMDTTNGMISILYELWLFYLRLGLGVVVGGGGRGSHFPRIVNSKPHLTGIYLFQFVWIMKTVRLQGWQMTQPAHASSSVTSCIHRTLLLDETLPTKRNSLQGMMYTNPPSRRSECSNANWRKICNLEAGSVSRKIHWSAFSNAHLRWIRTRIRKGVHCRSEPTQTLTLTLKYNCWDFYWFANYLSHTVR